MPIHTFILNGKQVSVGCEDDVRLLWVLRDLLGVTGPKYGCGLGVCKACTSHINGKSFTVAGVAPRGFQFPQDFEPVQLWTTLAEDASVTNSTPLTNASITPLISGRPTLSREMAQTPTIAKKSAMPLSLEIFSPNTSREKRNTKIGAVYWSTIALAAVVSLLAATNALMAAL